MIVLDASAVLDGLLSAATSPRLAALLVGAEDRLAAPDLLDVEAMSVLRRWERRGELDDRRARQLFDDLAELPIIRYPARAATRRAWRLRHNLTAYDAQYVALAQELRAELATTDERMATAAAAARVAVWAA